MVGELSKMLSTSVVGQQHKIQNYTGLKAVKQSLPPKKNKRNLDQKINDSKLHVSSLSSNFKLIARSFKANKNQQFFCSQNLTHYLNLLNIVKDILSQDSQKPYLFDKFSSKHVSGQCQKKTFALHYSQTPKNFILKALGKHIPVCSCISPYKNFCSRNQERII